MYIYIYIYIYLNVIINVSINDDSFFIASPVLQCRI